MIREYLKFRKEQRQFENLMIVMKLTGCKLIKHTRIRNGHILKVSIPPTLSFSDIEKKKGQLEDHFKGIIQLEKIRFTNMVNISVVTKDIGNYMYAPVRPLRYYKLFIGKTFDGEDYFIDLNRDAHILIAGVTGTGKSYLLATILTNIIYNYPKAFEIYLCQTAKRDIDYLKDCKGIKASLYTASETALVLEKAINEINRRSILFADTGCKGIDHYNKVTDSKLKRKIYVFEEISLYMADETDDEDEAGAKSKVWKMIWKIVKLGREVGIHFIGLTQRTTAANLGGSGEIKSQLCRITFRQAQDIDSRNVIDCDLACTLKEREVYALTTDGLNLIKVPSIDKEMRLLNKYVPEIKVANGKIIKQKIENINSFKYDSFDSYLDMSLEEYNKIISKKDENIIAKNEEEPIKTTTTEAPKKKRGRPRKGVVREDVTTTK